MPFRSGDSTQNHVEGSAICLKFTTPCRAGTVPVEDGGHDARIPEFEDGEVHHGIACAHRFDIDHGYHAVIPAEKMGRGRVEQDRR